MMFSKLRNLLLAGPALMGIVMLSSGPAIAIESSLSHLKGDSGDMELAACDASDAATFDFAPAEEDALPGKDAFTFQTDADAEEVALCIPCLHIPQLWCSQCGHRPQHSYRESMRRRWIRIGGTNEQFWQMWRAFGSI